MSVKLISVIEIFDKLDYTSSRLEKTKESIETRNFDDAFCELKKYFYNKSFFKHPLEDWEVIMEYSSEDAVKDHMKADNAIKHVFQTYKAFPPHDYGGNIDWNDSPYNELEWPASIHRHYWADPLLRTYLSTSDEKYASGWFDLTLDWSEKNKTDVHEGSHFAHWGGPWNVLQTGVRARKWCMLFPFFIKSQSATNKFIGEFLSSLYMHAKVIEEFEYVTQDNAAICQTLALLNIAVVFSEFKESSKWVELAVKRLKTIIDRDLNCDGMHKELNLNYHCWCTMMLIEAVKLLQIYQLNDNKLSDAAEKMSAVIVELCFPDNSLPVFGDDLRQNKIKELVLIKDMFGIERQEGKDAIFEESGYYLLKGGAGDDEINMALKCSPLATDPFHNQFDNGTFELFGYGRRLLSDSGVYSYKSEDPEREWFRQTSVHQTMTQDGKNIDAKPKLLARKAKSSTKILVVENESYPGFIHRRSVLFVDSRFFIIIDEAIGVVTGNVEIHFQTEPGPFMCDLDKKLAHTDFHSGGNILVIGNTDDNSVMLLEEGWFSEFHNTKVTRPAFYYRHDGNGACRFITLLLPYKGRNVPEVKLKKKHDENNPMTNVFVFDVVIDGKAYEIVEEL